MGLYLVPQSASDAAMTAAVARFKLRAPKPEAYSMPDATIALHLEEAYDAVRSALGDRLTELAVLLQVDARLDGAAHRLAARTLMGERGYNRDAAMDDEIVTLGEAAEAFLARCRPGGADGKSENPRFVTDDNVTNADAPVFTSALGGLGGSRRADDFIEARDKLTGAQGLS